MRVLFITGEFPPMQGGVGDCTNEIALALTQRGVQVSVLTTAIGAEANNSYPFPVFRTIKKWDWSALSQIRRTLAETNADLYHIQYQTGAFGMHPMINFAPRLLNSLSPQVRRGGWGVRSIVTFHDLRPMYLFPKAGRLRDWVTFQLARTTDAVIATNDEDCASLERLRLNRLGLIPIGSNINPSPPPDFNRDALRRQLGVKPDEILLCYFGFLNDSKGGETLIRALAQMSNAKLLMLGGQTGASDVTNVAYFAHINKTIDDLGLTPRVIWTDFLEQPQVSAHFLACDICVLPYRDGASYRRGTFLAALAHGAAIVTTEPPAPSERPSSFIAESLHLPPLRDGENVLLIPPDNPEAIVEAVQRIGASPELRAKIQHGARSTSQFFTWDKIADAHLQLYETLLHSVS